MRTPLLIVLGAILPPAAPDDAAKVLFEESFSGKLSEGWSWDREDHDAWRLTEKGLEIRTQPGNMWGKTNDAKNLLRRVVPSEDAKAFDIDVTVSSSPTEQYEQAGITWYYDDSNMVKLVKEQVDGKINIVMGFEEGDKTRTVAIIPQAGATFELRLRWKDGKVTGFYRLDGKGDWKDVGSTPPPMTKAKAQICLQTYNGPAAATHWAVFSGLRVTALP